MKRFIILLCIFICGGYSMGTENKPHRMLVLGASVGWKWDLPAWPARMKQESYYLEMVPYYRFDKSEALAEIIMRPKRKFRLTRTYLKGFFKEKPKKPELLVIKQCAAYFCSTELLPMVINPPFRHTEHSSYVFNF